MVKMLQPGTIVQYRKVGRARVVEDVTPAGYEGQSHRRYRLAFLTGPRKYREAPLADAGFWVRDSDKISDPAEVPPVSLAVLAHDAGELAKNLETALEAARGIRDRAEAASQRGLRDDDVEAIRRYKDFSATGVHGAAQWQAMVEGEVGRL